MSSGDYSIPVRIVRLNRSDAVKRCLASLWSLETGESPGNYKQQYLSIISDNSKLNEES